MKETVQIKPSFKTQSGIWTNVPIKSKLEQPPPRANCGHLTFFSAREVGNLPDKAIPGWGIDLCLGGVGKIEPKVSGVI